jgi:hypothetical protein
MEGVEIEAQENEGGVEQVGGRRAGTTTEPNGELSRDGFLIDCVTSLMHQRDLL